jgi:tetratricopeptide (TPR) repeat protein
MRHASLRVLPLAATLAGLALALAAVGGEYFRGVAQRKFAAAQTYEDVYYLPPPDYLVLGSLGYRAALADLIWMKALVYYGEELIHRGDVSHLYRYGDAMIALDPDFKRVYRWIASSALYRTGDVKLEDGHAAIRYLERAIKRFPDDGELAWELGATYTYELPSMLPLGPERDAARRKGLDYLEAAVLRNAGPPWLVLQTASELQALGRREQAIRHLEDVYAVASDLNVKQQIEQQLIRLRSASYAEALRRAHDDLESARARDFPYLDATLYLLVGARPVFGGPSWLERGFDPVATRSAEAEVLSD